MNSNMAAKFLLVFVLVTISIQRTFCFNCMHSVYEKIMNCDQCIKCGGSWCINPINEFHCARNRNDGGCLVDEKEIYPTAEANHTLIKVGKKSYFHTPDVKFEYNITPTGMSIRVDEKKKICTWEEDKYKCQRKFYVDVQETFCSDDSGPLQHFNISFEPKTDELRALKYSVPCACECSKKVSVNDGYCSGRGNLSCGVCTCDEKWEGKQCELEKPYDESEYPAPSNQPCKPRGDATNCFHPQRPDVECSGNGHCGDCCQCDRDKNGWQYFNQEESCEDLCMTSAKLLKADNNSSSIRFLNYNETVTKQRDSTDSLVWVKCNETIEEYIWEYWARKNSKGETAVMILKKSSPEAAAIAGGGVNVTALVVPVVLVAAVAMAAAAYYVFKGQGAAQLPTGGNYQELDAKTRVETNPVYIEPITSYKNPTYGQNN